MTEDAINRHASDLAEEICIYEDIESIARLRVLIRTHMRSLLSDVSDRQESKGGPR